MNLLCPIFHSKNGKAEACQQSITDTKLSFPPIQPADSALFISMKKLVGYSGRLSEVLKLHRLPFIIAIFVSEFGGGPNRGKGDLIVPTSSLELSILLKWLGAL